MKILFLDLDGVVNSYEWLKKPLEERIGVVCEKDEEDNLSWIDPAAVRHLNRVLAETGAKVVISSSWRKLHSLAEIERWLTMKGFIGEIVDMTTTDWHLVPTRPTLRGDQIWHWLLNNPSIDYFAIVDDDSDMTHLSRRHVKTWIDEGLTAEKADKLIEMLQIPFNRTSHEVW